MAFNEELQPISTLGQPLVTEPKNYGITPESVTMLLDAFKKGYINTNDIMEHTGAEAVAKNKSSMELLNISPDIVEAQKAQANLNTARAKADINLLPAEAAEKKRKLTEPDSDLWVKKHMEYGNPLTYTKDAEGKAVWNRKADEASGAKLLQWENQLKMAQIGLTPVRVAKVYDKKLERFVEVPLNAFGEPTNPGTPGNPNKYYDQHLDKANSARANLVTGDNTSWHPDNLVVPKSVQDAAESVFSKPTVSAEPPAPVTASFVEPLPAGPIEHGAAQAWLANAGAMPITTAATLQDKDAVEIYQDYVRHRNAPVDAPAAGPIITVEQKPDGTTSTSVAPQPVVQPRGLQPSATVPGGMVEPRRSQESSVTGGIANRVDTSKITSAMRSSGLYKNWEDKDTTIRWGRSTIAKYDAPRDDKVTNQLDLDLARAATLLGTPGGGSGGRGPIEERVPNIEAATPVLEALTGLPGHVFKTHRFDDKVRKRVIESFERKAQAAEEVGRGVVSSVRDQIIAEGGDPELDLFGPEKELLGTSSAAATGTSRGSVRLDNGRNLNIWVPGQ